MHSVISLPFATSYDTILEPLLLEYDQLLLSYSYFQFASLSRMLHFYLPAFSLRYSTSSSRAAEWVTPLLPGMLRQLTHLFLIRFTKHIYWASPFPDLGLLDAIFHFYSNFNRAFCKKTVYTLIKRRVMRRLI